VRAIVNAALIELDASENSAVSNSTRRALFKVLKGKHLHAQLNDVDISRNLKIVVTELEAANKSQSRS
jgi:hypothetical protein